MYQSIVCYWLVYHTIVCQYLLYHIIPKSQNIYYLQVHSILWKILSIFLLHPKDRCFHLPLSIAPRGLLITLYRYLMSGKLSLSKVSITRRLSMKKGFQKEDCWKLNQSLTGSHREDIAVSFLFISWNIKKTTKPSWLLYVDCKPYFSDRPRSLS